MGFEKHATAQVGVKRLVSRKISAAGELDVMAAAKEADEEDFKPLTREEAQSIRALNPPASLWRVVAGQAGVGAVSALLAWGTTGSVQMLWSVGYGALSVVLPAALFARGLARQKLATHENASLVGFFVWEMVKIGLTIAMLFAAPKLVEGLNWFALVAGFVVTMKVYWVAMWFRPARKKSDQSF